MRAVSIAIILCCAPMATVTWAQSLRACGGDNNWPPMSYIAGDSDQPQGISVDILRMAFADRPDFAVSLRPWGRCLLEAQENRGFDIVMSLLRNPEREQQFLFTRPYLSLNPAYLYDQRRFTAPPIKRLADLSRYKVCALANASTNYTKLPAGSIDTGTPSYTGLLGKVDRGYCDVVVDMREVLMGFVALRMLPMETGLYRIEALPETERYPLQFGVSRKHPHAAELITAMDSTIQKLQSNGRLAGILAKYQITK